MMFFHYDHAAIEYLSAKDALLGAAIERIGHIQRAVSTDIFSSIVHHIVGQQISTVAQETIWKRLCHGLGTIDAQTLCNCSREALQAYGLSFRKVDYILDFAQKVHDGEFSTDALAAMSDHEVIESLCRLKGIGVWTAEMLLLFCLQRPDVVSFGDLAILRGMRMLYGHETLNKELFDTYARSYSPYGSVASLYLWAVAGGALPELHDPAPTTAKKEKTLTKTQKKASDKSPANASPKISKKPLHTAQETYASYYQSPHGALRIIATQTHILSVKRHDTADDAASDELASSAPLAHVTALCTQLDEYFAGRRKHFDLPFQLHGTDFQKKVWQALCDIPYGETRSYQDIALAVGNVKACRAVGLANNKNPMSIVVPCHRVIGKGGKLVGYAGGLKMKEALLAHEGAHSLSSR